LGLHYCRACLAGSRFSASVCTSDVGEVLLCFFPTFFDVFSSDFALLLPFSRISRSVWRLIFCHLFFFFLDPREGLECSPDPQWAVRQARGNFRRRTRATARFARRAGEFFLGQPGRVCRRCGAESSCISSFCPGFVFPFRGFFRSRTCDGFWVTACADPRISSFSERFPSTRNA